MSTKIIFNGKTYSDPSEMPQEVRQAYQQALGLLADADQNGVPDLLERTGLGNVISIQRSQVIVNGQIYEGPEEMPPAIRQLYEQALSQAHGKAVPDPAASLSTSPVAPSTASDLQLKWGARPPTDSGSTGWFRRLLLLIAVAFLGFVLVALWLAPRG